MWGLEKYMPGRSSLRGPDGKPEVFLNYTQKDLDRVDEDIAQATTEERKKALLAEREEIVKFLSN